MKVEETQETRWLVVGENNEALAELHTVHGSDRIDFGSLRCTSKEAEEIAKLLKSASELAAPKRQKKTK